MSLGNTTNQILLPNQWRPRQHQLPVWNYMQRGGDRAALCWHRRAGKDSFAVNYLATYAMQHKGMYWHMFPQTAQARKALWNGIDRYGRRIIDQAFPKQIRRKTLETEMFIELINGSTVQFVGSDNYDSLVGAGPKGVIFSEYAICNPAAWAYIRPMVKETQGWAIFISTPRGHNHFYDLHQMASDNENWFAERLTVDDTYKEDGTPIFSPEDVQEERDEGMSEEEIQQEYYCSWEGGMQGAYYSDEIQELRETRLNLYPTPHGESAITAWDIGLRDKNVVLILGRTPEGYPLLMDTYAARDKGMAKHLNHLRTLPYNYVAHYGPHDLGNRDYFTGERRIDAAAQYGVDFDLTPKVSIEEGIHQCRSFLQRLHVNDNQNNRDWLNAMAAYQRKYDDKLQRYQDKPLHNWASDYADAARYASLVYDPTLFDYNRNQTPQVHGTFNQSFDAHHTAPQVMRSL